MGLFRILAFAFYVVCCGVAAFAADLNGLAGTSSEASANISVTIQPSLKIHPPHKKDKETKVEAHGVEFDVRYFEPEVGHKLPRERLFPPREFRALPKHTKPSPGAVAMVVVR